MRFLSYQRRTAVSVGSWVMGGDETVSARGQQQHLVNVSGPDNI
jgi:hypothetical protein